MRKAQIGVIGSAGAEEYPYAKPNKNTYRLAYKIGKLIAKEGAILVCGGKGGVMEEACRGAKENGGITVGVISGNERRKSNKYVDVEVVSGIVNCGEEALIISMADGIVAMGGGAGTLQEIALAYRNKKPIVIIRNLSHWTEKLVNKYLDDRKLIKIIGTKTPEQAIKRLLKLI